MTASKNPIALGDYVRLGAGPLNRTPIGPTLRVESIDGDHARCEHVVSDGTVRGAAINPLDSLIRVHLATNPLTPSEDPPSYREFDGLYEAVIRANWQDPELPNHVARLTTFLQQHRDLYSNKHIMTMIKNARAHCDGGSIHYTF